MMRNKLVEEKERQQRLDSKTLDNQFRRRIEEGASCSPFVSQAILLTAKEVYPLSPQDEGANLGLGQLRLLVVAANEPAGKALEECQKVTVRLTLDAGIEDFELRARYGVIGLRRARVLRLATEACEQGGLLTYEDLAYRLLNCGVRTIIRDVAEFQKEGVNVTTRGQQQDIGPGQTHRVQAVRLYLEGFEANEIARRLYHTMSSIENYVTTFARVVLLIDKGYVDEEIRFVIHRSAALVAAYRKLYDEFRTRRIARRRLKEILARVQPTAGEKAKKGGRRP